MSPSFFPRLLAATVTIIALLAPAAQASSYATISPEVGTDAADKIEVLEFFTYACGPCAAMEPKVEQWVRNKPADVVFKQVPVAFNAGMQPLQQLYYTLQALNRADLHAKVFAVIHQERRRLFDKKSIREWVVSQGVDGARFDSVFDSFGVQAQVQRANNLFKAYRIEGTPSFTVGGKYVTSPAMAGNSYAAAIDEINKLIPMARN